MYASLTNNRLHTAINEVISVSYLAQKYQIFSLTKHFPAADYPNVDNHSHIRPTNSKRVFVQATQK